jgi:hypothetical protein
VLDWIWVSAAVPVGIVGLTLGLERLEARLLSDIPPAGTDPVGGVASGVSVMTAGPAVNPSLAMAG